MGDDVCFFVNFVENLFTMGTMNREIFHIALPAIVANVTVPLLGLVDTAIAGHLGAPSFIGGVAVGTMMFNLVYWNFGFLRMSTSGLTAQCFGARDEAGSARILLQAGLLAVLIALALIMLQRPLEWLAIAVIGPSGEVTALASSYFRLVIWGALPTLVMMAVKGWLLGMQDSRGAMYISIGVNVLNIIASVVCVYGLGMGFMGIAVGTLVAEWLGLAAAAGYLAVRYGWLARSAGWRTDGLLAGASRFFKVSADIFVRSLLMMVMNLAVVSIGARSGDLILAVNALMSQLNIFYAYFLDGIAFAGEALVGKYVGRADEARLRQCVRRLFVWAGVLTAVFTVVYAIPQPIFRLLTDDAAVLAESRSYAWWCALLPVAGMAAFVWDGVFIGLTYSRGMLWAVAVSTALFFLIYMALPSSLGNHRLWAAFVIDHVARGAVQTLLYYRRRLYRIKNPQKIG